MSFLKDLIFEKEGTKEVKPTKTSESSFKSKFPSSSNGPDKFSFPSIDSDFSSTSTLPTSEISCEPYLNSIMEMYEKGFDSLNQDGYDFYEYFKAVVEGGADNNAVYGMAFKMGNAMGGNIDKKTLLEQGIYYINKLNDVHSNYKTEGNNKKIEISNQKSVLDHTLTKELSDLDNEISRLQSLKISKQTELSKIDNNFSPKLNEIDCKLQANDVAKDKLVASISLVVNGIKNNI